MIFYFLLNINQLAHIHKTRPFLFCLQFFFLVFQFFSAQSTCGNGTETKAKTFFWVLPSPLCLETRTVSTKGRKEMLLVCTVSALVWKISLRSGNSGKSRPGSRSRSKTAQDLSGLSGFPARFERFERFGRFGRFFWKNRSNRSNLA